MTTEFMALALLALAMLPPIFCDFESSGYLGEYSEKSAGDLASVLLHCPR